MMRRITITAIFIFGTLLSVCLPQSDAPIWLPAETHFALPPAVPVQSSETEARNPILSATALIQQGQQLRFEQPAVGPRLREAPPQARWSLLPVAPLAPDLPRFSPRAPPPVS